MNPAMKYVLRSMRRSPGFVIIATLSMGVALGISTSVFAVMDAVRHPDPPFRDVSQLYRVTYYVLVAHPPPPDSVIVGIAALDGVERVARWRHQSEVMTVFAGNVETSTIGLAGPGLFEVLGARPRLGRLLTQGDQQAGDVAVVTDMIWRRDFNNRASLADATVQAGNRIYRIVGVLPTGADRALAADVIVPDTVGTQSLSMVVHAKPGVTSSTLVKQLSALNDRLSKANLSARDRGYWANVGPLRPDPLELNDNHRAMIGGAICVLLIACANVAALLLARGLVKKRDYALRLALGSPPSGIANDVITEVGILAVVGCGAGVVVTSWCVELIGRAMPPEMTWQGFAQPQWSWRVLVLAMVTVVGCIAVAGGFPAWLAARTDPAGPLKESSGSTTGRSGTRFRWLIIAELAIAMTLLVSTSLMLKSTWKMRAYNFGYPANRLLYAAVSAPWRQDSTTPAEQARLEQEGLAVVRAVPGVEAAILTSRENCPPYAQTLLGDRTVEGGAALSLISDTYGAGGGCSAVGPRYLSTIELPFADGRDFEDGDAQAGGAAILDEPTAHRLFPHERAVGRMVKIGTEKVKSPWLPVVGVVRKHMLGFDYYPEISKDSAVKVYVIFPPVVQRNRKHQPIGSRSFAFLVRTDSNTTQTSLALARALVPITPTLSRSGVTRWDQDFQQMLRVERFLTLIFTCLGLAAVLLGAAGLFSVISYVAEQRMREFAVRVALGATRRNLARLVLREAFTMAIGGTAVGAGFGMWAGFLLWNKMWGVYPVDAQALMFAELALLAITMVACVKPALRAARADPLEVMRAT